jgi:hypothetical protein
MILAEENNAFSYSHITCTANYKDIDEQYRFIINRLLIKLNAFIAKKSASIDIYYIEISNKSPFPTLHFVIKGSISNEELDNYLYSWTIEFKKLLNHQLAV